MRKLCVMAVSLMILAGCEGRIFWDDNGALDEATTDRKVWDSNGQMDSGERKIWNDREGKPVIQ